METRVCLSVCLLLTLRARIHVLALLLHLGHYVAGPNQGLPRSLPTFGCQNGHVQPQSEPETIFGNQPWAMLPSAPLSLLLLGKSTSGVSNLTTDPFQLLNGIWMFKMYAFLFMGLLPIVVHHVYLFFIVTRWATDLT